MAPRAPRGPAAAGPAERCRAPGLWRSRAAAAILREAGREGGRPQSHIGMHEIAGGTGIVRLFLFEEKRILIVCWGEKDS